MKLEHIIIEGFCEEIKNESFPCKGSLKFSAFCLECPKFSFTVAPKEIAYSDENSVVKEWISFGGDMNPDDETKAEACSLLWEKICKRKINEAYEEYMKEKKFL